VPDDKICASLFNYVGPGTAGPARSSGRTIRENRRAALKRYLAKFSKWYLAIDSRRSGRCAPVLPGALSDPLGDRLGPDRGSERDAHLQPPLERRAWLD